MGLQSISTVGDPNSHGAGFLQPSQIKVNCKSIPVILFADFSGPDIKCDDGDRHCYPWAIEGSLRVFVLNTGVHRRSDKRACGAVTIPFSGNIKVFAG